MSVLSWLLVAPSGLLLVLGLSWFEDHVLRPPTSPADQVLQNDPGTGSELLSLVRVQPRRIELQKNVQDRNRAA